MSQIQGEGILLNVQLSEDEVSVRLDQHGIALREEKEPAVVTLTLIGCRDSSEVREFLNRFVGKWLTYECYPSEQAKAMMTACFYEEYHDQIEIVCAEVIEALSDYKPEDLLYKCRQLSSLYLDTADRESQIHRQYYAFTTGLRAEIDNELDRCRRKLEFFLTINSQKAAAMQAQVSAYERVLTLISHQQESG